MSPERLTKHQLRRAHPENVRRLARWLHLKRIDEMSLGQLIRLLDWLLKRREKRQRGLTLW